MRCGLSELKKQKRKRKGGKIKLKADVIMMIKKSPFSEKQNNIDSHITKFVLKDCTVVVLRKTKLSEEDVRAIFRSEIHIKKDRICTL